MQRVFFLFMMLTILSLFAVRGASAAEEGKKPPKKAILLVAFGTSIPEAQTAYDQIDAAVKKTFPGTEIRWAFTSKIIRAKLTARIIP